MAVPENGAINEMQCFKNIFCVTAKNYSTKCKEFSIFNKVNGKCLYRCAYSPYELKEFEKHFCLILVDQVITFDKKSGERIKTLDLGHNDAWLILLTWQLLKIALQVYGRRSV